jgi:hypothetical protein
MDRCLYAVSHSGIQYITHRLVDNAHADLYPGKRLGGKRKLSLAASILLPLLLVLVSWSMHLHTGRDALADQGSTRRFKVPPKPAVASASVLSAPSSVDPAVSAFLSIYQLDRYRVDFMHALQRGSLDILAQRIYGETGYQLVQLDTVPDWIRQRYGALAFSIGPGKTPTWLLFWRPRIELKRFYTAYRGEEIVKLQQLLGKLRLYQYDLDGIVGRRLMTAVLHFQRQNGLPVTGFPDTTTLFWVCHQQENIANG